jgi:COP9 signalosome complex subunit 3
MVYLALKKWSEASHFLELVMAIPTTGPVSMIMVEAYKKWVLVGLLETGKVSQAEPSHQAFSDTTMRLCIANISPSFVRLLV